DQLQVPDVVPTWLTVPAPASLLMVAEEAPGAENVPLLLAAWPSSAVRLGLFSVTLGAFRMLVDVPVWFSPSWTLRVAAREGTLVVLSWVMSSVLLMVLRVHPLVAPSTMVLDPKDVRVNTLVLGVGSLATVPSSMRLKFERPVPVVVKEKAWLESGLASLMTGMRAGKVAASLESERSWLPPLPSRAIRRVWNGEPEMATTELADPQSGRRAICPPQVRTALAAVALKLMVMRVELSLA